MRLAGTHAHGTGDDAHRVGRDRRGEAPRRVPLNRWITPDEIAAAIVSLTGPEFSALHGANVIIDAGYDAWGGHF